MGTLNDLEEASHSPLTLFPLPFPESLHSFSPSHPIAFQVVLCAVAGEEGKEVVIC